MKVFVNTIRHTTEHTKLFNSISIYKPLENKRLKKITQVYTFLL